MISEIETMVNEACARLCGWRWRVLAGGRTPCFEREPSVPLTSIVEDVPTPPDLNVLQEWQWGAVPSYTTDRNALLEIFDGWGYETWFDYYREMIELTGAKHCVIDHARIPYFEQASPLIKCIASLKACKVWTCELDSMWLREQSGADLNAA